MQKIMKRPSLDFGSNIPQTPDEIIKTLLDSAETAENSLSIYETAGQIITAISCQTRTEAGAMNPAINQDPKQDTMAVLMAVVGCAGRADENTLETYAAQGYMAYENVMEAAYILSRNTFGQQDAVTHLATFTNALNEILGYDRELSTKLAPPFSIIGANESGEPDQDADSPKFLN